MDFVPEDSSTESIGAVSCQRCQFKDLAQLKKYDERYLSITRVFKDADHTKR